MSDFTARSDELRDVTGLSYCSSCVAMDTEEDGESFKDLKRGKYCSAGAPNNKSCKNSSTTPQISMHKFPKPGHALRNTWVKFAKKHREDTWQPSSCAYLCSAHFEPHFYQQRTDIDLHEGEMYRTKKMLDRSIAYPTIDTAESEQRTNLLSPRDRRQVCCCDSSCEPL